MLWTCAFSPNPNANLRVTRVFCSVGMAQFVLKIAKTYFTWGSARYSEGYASSPIMAPD